MKLAASVIAVLLTFWATLFYLFFDRLTSPEFWLSDGLAQNLIVSALSLVVIAPFTAAAVEIVRSLQSRKARKYGLSRLAVSCLLIRAIIKSVVNDPFFAIKLNSGDEIFDDQREQQKLVDVLRKKLLKETSEYTVVCYACLSVFKPKTVSLALELEKIHKSVIPHFITFMECMLESDFEVSAIADLRRNSPKIKHFDFVHYDRLFSNLLESDSEGKKMLREPELQKLGLIDSDFGTQIDNWRSLAKTVFSARDDFCNHYFPEVDNRV